MKKIFLFSFILFTVASQAQIKVGVSAGVNRNNQRVNVTEGSIYGSNKLEGFHAGLIGDIELGRNFYLQPQLQFARKGAQHLNLTGSPVTKIKFNYLEAPVNLVYKFNLPFGHIIAGTGVTYSYALGGKSVEDGSSSKLFAAGSAWSRHDLGLNFTTGLEFNNGLFITLNSQKGLLDINKTGHTSVKNKSTSITVGYLIDWKMFNRKA